ncbi:hypothetical protein FQN57_004279 [Myotisia sp. PD_48]|nr:hypothetical protein FQN57_004279 [Myotisia sp. PD_48]
MDGIPANIVDNNWHPDTQAPSSCTTTRKTYRNGSIWKTSSCRELSSYLRQECEILLSEITAFQSHFSALSKPNLVELRQFKNSLLSESKTLQKLVDKVDQAIAEDKDLARRKAAPHDDESEDEIGPGPAEKKLLHSLRSSNLPFFAAVWRVAKTSTTGLVAFNKRFYYGGSGTANQPRGEIEMDFQGLDVTDGPDQLEYECGSSRHTTPRKRSVFVDIVADNGEEWVKVSTVTPSRLLFELAEQGWEVDWSSDSEGQDEDEDEGGGSTPETKTADYESEDQESAIELIRLAYEMKKAQAAVRVRYKHPRIRFVLPKIEEGQISEVDRIVRKIRRIGIAVQCGDIGSLPEPNSNDSEIEAYAVAPSLQSTFTTLLPDPFPDITPTLNVDCTLLLALVSDLSHVRNLPCSPAYHAAINRQIEVEAERPLMLTSLWPAIGDRELVCTQEAAKRMHEIVRTIGTDQEKERAKLLMGETDQPLDRATIISRFQELSGYTVPLDWKLPVRIVGAQQEIEQAWENGRLPNISRKIAQDLHSDINRSVFLYGWASGLMTISSNRTVVRQIEALVEEYRADDDLVCGPKVWLCDTARSLIGKDMNRG